MAKLPRKTLKQFGNAGPTSSFGQFGSKEAGFPQTSQDPTVIQQLAAWVQGWQNAVVNSDKAAYLEDMNGLCFVYSYMMAYLFQAGVAEWDANTTYYIDSVVQVAGQWFSSLQDNNVGNLPPVGASNAFWLWVNPPQGLVGSATLNKIPKVTNAAPSNGVPGSALLGDSLLSDNGTNVIIGGVAGTNGLQFPDATVQKTAAVNATVLTQNVVTGSRAINITYHNTSAKAMYVSICLDPVGGANQFNVLSDAGVAPTTVIYINALTAGFSYQIFFVVLPGNYYQLHQIFGGGPPVLTNWTESV